MNPAALHPETTDKQRRVQRYDLGPLIYQTVLDLNNAGRQASRQVLMELLGVKYAVIDDHVKRLVDDGRLRRVANGIFEAITAYPETRPVSLTSTADGYTIAEVGDDVLKMTPPEVYRLAKLLAGYQLQAAASAEMKAMGDSLAVVIRHVTAQREQIAEAAKWQAAADARLQQLTAPQEAAHA